MIIFIVSAMSKITTKCDHLLPYQQLPSLSTHLFVLSVSNTVDLLRLLKMYTPEINKICSLVFLKCGYQHCVTVIECTFVAAPPQFNVVMEHLSLSDVRTWVLEVITGSLKWIDLVKRVPSRIS